VSTRRNPEDRSPEALARHLVAYARGVSVSSPLNGRLLLAVADDPDLLALEIAQEPPSPVVAGDALALLPGILDSILEDAVPCVFHTHAVYQFAPEDRHRLHALLVERSALRDVVVRIGMEPYEAGRSVLSISIYRHGYAAEQRLADCDYHGAWLAWNPIRCVTRRDALR
jgi:hypothetical protein